MAELAPSELQAIVGWILSYDGGPEDWPVDRKIQDELGIIIDTPERDRLIEIYVQAQAWPYESLLAEIKQRRDDPVFRASLERIMAEQKTVLDRLAEDD